MPQYSKGDEKKYFPPVVAALIIAAIAIATLIYSFMKAADNVELAQPMGSANGMVQLNPADQTQTPKAAPAVPSPTTPPPGN